MYLEKALSYPKAWLATGLAFLSPIHGILGVVSALVVLDLITGIWAAKKRGEPIQSAKLRNSVSKLLIYVLALVACHMLDFLTGGIVPFVKLLSGLIAITEGKSLLENLNYIQGGDLFKVLLEKLGSPNLKK